MSAWWFLLLVGVIGAALGLLLAGLCVAARDRVYHDCGDDREWEDE